MLIQKVGRQQADRYKGGDMPRTWALIYNDISEPFTFYEEGLYELEVDLVVP